MAAPLYRVVDGHCDAPGLLTDEAGRPDPARADRFLSGRLKDGKPEGHMDLPRLKAGGVSCQFMACFVGKAWRADYRGRTLALLEATELLASRSGGELVLARKAADIEAAAAAGRIALVSTIEGGDVIGEDLGALDDFWDRGVRLMTLTWNHRNAIGRGAGTGDPGADGTGGLTPFGLSVVARMEKLGMIVDASHLSDEALEDLLAAAERPVVASHSNCRELCPHRRNLEDRHIEAIARTGGLVAATCAPYFVDSAPGSVGLGRLADHLDRLVRLAGADHVGLGGDFEGYDDEERNALDGCDGYPALARELEIRGHGQAAVAAILGGNWLRVLKETAG